MPPIAPQWQVQPTFELPDEFVQAVQTHTNGLLGRHIAQLLWQRGMRDLREIDGFLNAKAYRPTSALAFGAEMQQAIARLHLALEQDEKVAIWGDFDADGITATAVLWDGLGQFFPQDKRLTYTIPNRLRESHGLAIAGINQLAAEGVQLIVTCDTGSTNLREIEHARSLGIDIIITDHHTLSPDRPPVSAIINPRYLPPDHPLATLSGVAVAYKLVEALYETLPQIPSRPLEDLLDLVAIGLIADLVELRGDCRYLAQMGIERLQLNQTQNPPPRPGIAKLLELCRRNGDRPTDISFGIGPRINAISRIHGDARFGVELLTSQDAERCQQLAEETELANARRKALQKDVTQQVTLRLAQTDLSTTRVIVLEDPQWSVGVLGLVAGQIAQTYGRPTILLSRQTDSPSLMDELSVDPTDDRLALPTAMQLARGSARSVNQINLYALVKEQAHLLQSFGGHPYAAGLSLLPANIPLFAEAVNRQLRQQSDAGDTPSAVVQADLTVTVAELGKELFAELKLLEPCGMGNPVPRLLIQNCWFENVWNRNIKDVRGGKLRYIKTEFVMRDASGASFPGVWWEHYKEEIPPGRCDAIAELDFNAFHKRYEVRLIALRASVSQTDPPTATVDWIVDWRSALPSSGVSPRHSIDLSPPVEATPEILQITHCPDSWDVLQLWFRRAVQEGKGLAIAYPPPPDIAPLELWQRLVGIAKYLSRTGQTVSRSQLLDKLRVGDRTLHLGFQALLALGFQVFSSNEGFFLSWQSATKDEPEADALLAIERFLAAIQEERFRQQYFATVPLDMVKAVARQSL